MNTVLSALITGALVAQTGLAAALPHTLDARAFDPTGNPPPLTPIGTSIYGYTSIGCYQDTYAYGRQILALSQNVGGPLTLAYCAALASGYQYFGVSNGHACYWGNEILSYSDLASGPVPADRCSVPCYGDHSENCGSDWTNAMYQLTSSLQAASPWEAASSACTAEGTNGRALNGARITADDMTSAKCTAFCSSKGFAIAGVEYGTECYCGDSLVNGASLAKTSTRCDMPCPGDRGQNCGGPGSLKLFVLPSTAASLNNDLTAQEAAIPSGWSAASTPCLGEGSTGRALTGASSSGPDMTPAKCTSFCADQGFKYAGVEYGQECFCGSTFSNGAALDKASSSCNMPCSGSPTSICGGPNALSLFENPSITPAVITGYTAAGCIQEVAGRALTGLRVDNQQMTQETCIASCAAAGYKYAGVEYGVECYCGNALVNGASLSLTSGQCYMACPGSASASKKCGGPNALQLFVAQ